ncbi:Methyl viologen resistance protein SmvA [Pseudomonas fluorescens]|uniref:Methyl viologen resistance protein SmvA n=1 Tax=Pseudomonas fluorescens TaxID=294 RepID=A0A5E6WKN8_PSEFL|nr:MFS transporter [Pseudomonas fluorescens]VVN29266.1 Methyl viologen resistance protein SmvA [Pseudomonas fluorescens]
MLNGKLLVLVVVSVAVFLVGLDMTVLYTALPIITHELQASNSDKMWIVNAYPLVMAGLVLGVGTVADRVGHRPVLLAGLVVFGLASIVAAFAPSVSVLIVGRVLLAVGAAMILPASLALLRHLFETDQERAIAIGVWGAMFSGAAAIGPIVGGVLLNNFWWGSVFLMNVPVVLVALVCSVIMIKHTPGNPDRSWDLVSSAQVMVGLVGITYGLEELTKPEINALHAMTAATIGIISLTSFVRRQKRSNDPIVDFTLFRSSQFMGGVLSIIVSMIAFIGVQLVMTQQLQLVEGFSPLKAGLCIVPISLAAFCAGPLVGSVLHRIGAIRVLWSSLVLGAIGLVGVAVFAGDFFALQLVSLGVFGFGAASGMTSASSIIMLSTPDEKAGMAASIEAVFYEFSSVLGVVVMGGIATFSYTSNLIVPHDIANASIAKDSLDQALILAQSLSADTASQLIADAKAAFNQAYFNVLVASAALMLVLAGVLATLFSSNEVVPHQVIE